MVNHRLKFPAEASFGRFDQVVGLVAFTLLLGTGLLIWRGDRAGVPVANTFPNNGATDVSAQTPIRVTFGQLMETAEVPEITLEPAVPGLARWQGATTLVFQPERPLDSETSYSVTIPAGLQSRQGRPLLKPVRWQFTTRPLRVLFTTWNEDNQNHLFAVPAGGGPPVQLTFPPDDVVDYSLSPDGSTIAYSTYRSDGGSDLWAVDSDGSNRRQLIDCAQGACNNPAWEPNSRRIIYERRTFSTIGGPPGPPRLWWLDLNSNATVAVFEDSQWLGSFARFSPDGRWISYISPTNQEIQAYHLESGRSIRIPSSTGEPASWGKDSNTLLITEIDFSGERYSLYMYKVNLETTEVTQLSGEIEISDGWPTWSPDGEWIAFNRKLVRAPMGKQLWMMRPDGSEMTQLTNEPELHHGPPAWSPDGRWLVFQRYALAEPNAEPGIWLMDVHTQELHLLAEPGTQPIWLP